MSVSVASIIDRAQTILQDTTGIRWPALELTDWVADAQREIVLALPHAGAITATVVLNPADSLQRLPSSAIQLLRVIRNVGGRAIRAADRDILDSQVPGWHNDTATEVLHYVHDPLDPLVFYVYPRATGSVEVLYSQAPDVAGAAPNIALPDIYANAVLDYTLYRAYSKDAEATANRELADAAYGRFTGSLGLSNQANAAGAYATQVRRSSPVGS